MATLKEEMQATALELITDDFSSIAFDVIIRSNSVVYDPTYGEVLCDTTHYKYPAIVGPWEDERTDTNDIQSSDLRIIIPALLIEAPIIAQEDTIVVEDMRYDIISVKIDAAEATYTLQARGRDGSDNANF